MTGTAQKIVYVTRDAERAAGMAQNEDYLIVTNIIHSDKKAILDTAHLLKLTSTEQLIEGNTAAVLVFKNNQLIENICRENNWKLLNPPATLAEKIENKISQVAWLGDLADRYLPPHHIGGATSRGGTSNSDPVVLQWAHGHTGDGTILIKSQNELRALQEKFPERLARMTKYIEGPSFTVNAVVAQDKILTGNVSYQITGLAPFTDNPFSTVGNDWGVVGSLLDGPDIGHIEGMAREIGEKMSRDGWRGLFGLDVIKDIRSGKIFLIEINARQPASTTFESQLQSLQPTDTDSTNVTGNDHGSSRNGITIFQAHLLALQNKPIDQPIIRISNGAQIIQRTTKAVRDVPEKTTDALETAGYKVISYPNTEMNSDLVRIQSRQSFIESHGKLNENGRRILKIIQNQ